MRLLTLPLVITLIGCDDKDTGTTDTGDTAEEAPFAPEEGAWQVTDFQAIVDECGMMDKAGDFDLTLAMTSETDFTLVGNEFDLTCTLSDMAFACADEVDVQDYTSEADVILTITFRYSGTFTDAASGEMGFGIDIDCEGKDCPVLEENEGIDLPCTSDATTTFTFQG